MNTYSGFMHDYQKLEIIQVFFNWKMDKQTAVYPYNGISLSNKKE